MRNARITRTMLRIVPRVSSRGRSSPPDGDSRRSRNWLNSCEGCRGTSSAHGSLALENPSRASAPHPEMAMKHDHKKKLALNPETLRTLSNREIDDVVGGLGNITHSCVCGSGVCSIVGNCDIKQGNQGNQGGTK
jgi:hypothetical protein